MHDASRSSQVRLSTSVIAARQELREFVKALGIKEILEKVASTAQEEITQAA